MTSVCGLNSEHFLGQQFIYLVFIVINVSSYLSEWNFEDKDSKETEKAGKIITTAFLVLVLSGVLILQSSYKES